MRDVLHDKLGEDQVANVKNKEKNVALFNEVVRLGQELERQSDQLQQLNAAIDTKLQTLEAKLSKAEQDAVNAESAGSGYTSLLSKQTERSEKRFIQLEDAFQSLAVRLMNDPPQIDCKQAKDGLGLLESLNAQTAEELQGSFRQLLSDLSVGYGYGGKQVVWTRKLATFTTS